MCMSDITREEFKALQNDVTAIKEALIGNEYNRNSGYSSRINSLERFKAKQEKSNNIMKGILIVVSTLYTLGLVLLGIFYKNN